ncbi:MAG: ribonuclease D [Propionibacteriaceae bacterium]|nr:ribonuclease D [Propionibacteriaceae bacterium]
MSEESVQPYETPAPDVIETDDALAQLVADLRRDPGPVAVDTERACGYRYDQRAYLIQLKTLTTGIALIDPIGIHEQAFADLDSALSDKEWILHAASQDLPSLRQCGLNPRVLFDTELCARLLGREKVGLGPMVADVVGVTLAKEHSNSDWSVRPLPESWLSYAAGDVEFLIELVEREKQELADSGKTQWAREEFEYLLTQDPPEPKPDPWRRTADIHLVRTRRGLGLVREFYVARDLIAQETDLAPHRIVNDRAITAMAARVSEDSVSQARKALHWGDWKHRVNQDYLPDFAEAVERVASMGPTDLPPLKSPRPPIPAPGQWHRRNPEAAVRWDVVRPALLELAQTLCVPLENLLAPKALRALLWEPTGTDPASVDAQLARLQARPWQRQIVVPVICDVLATHASLDAVASDAETNPSALG